MTGAISLQRGRALAEQADHLKLSGLVGDLLLLARPEPDEYYVARCWNLSAPRERRDLGLVIVRFARVRDALAMSLSGRIVTRVAPGNRLVGPPPGDLDHAMRFTRCATDDAWPVEEWESE